MTPVLLTLLGKDQPDVLIRLSRIVTDHSAEWMETQITRVNGHITGMAMLEVNEDQVEPLVEALRGLPETQVTSVATGTPDPGIPRVLQLNVLGPDYRELVPDLLGGLVKLGLQAKELRTHHHTVEGEEFFGATFMLAVQPNASGDIHGDVMALAERLNLQADLENLFDGA